MSTPFKARLGRIAGVLLMLSAIAGSAVPRAEAGQNVLRVWYGTDDPTEGPLAKTMAARFQASHAGVQVQLTTYSLDDINEKLQLVMSAGSPPDLIYTTPRGPGLPAYLRAGKLLDLSSVAARDGWAAKLPAGMLATYNDALTPTGRADARVYAAPSIVAAVAVLYNKQLFDRFHWSLPRSAAEFESLCAKAKAAGLTPIGFGNADGWVGDDWFITLVNAETGPEPLVPELRLDPHFSFSGPPFLAAASTLVTWADRGYFTPKFGGLDAQDSVEAFFDGHTAMQLISSTQNGQIAALARETKIPVGVFGFPNVKKGLAPVVPQSGYAGWAVPRDSRQPALAEQFIDSMLGDSTARAFGAHGLLPAHGLASADYAAFSSLQQDYVALLKNGTPGVYLDGAPVPNLNATMEANIQLLLQHFEKPSFLVHSLQLVYDSHGSKASSTRTDGEF